MLQDIAPHIFHNQWSNASPSNDSIILCFWEDHVYMAASSEDCSPQFPTYASLQAMEKLSTVKLHYLFAMDGTRFFYGNTSLWAKFDTLVPYDFSIFRTLTPSFLGFAGITGAQLYRWERNNRFCGRCGAENVHRKTERALECPLCANIIYPKISPAVIVGITMGDHILLTKYNGRAYKNYSLVAGFMEIGETPEDTVRREVMEEVGLHVKDIRYFKSQPWAFSDSLLLGFFAQLDGTGDILLDENELSFAQWFPRSEVPADISTLSLTGEMIAAFRKGLI